MAGSTINIRVQLRETGSNWNEKWSFSPEKWVHLPTGRATDRQSACQHKKFEYLTARISDYDGKWSELFDSVYLGLIELDNETIIKDTPLIVIKNYEQQAPLSYHYKNIKLFSIDNKTFSIL